MTSNVRKLLSLATGWKSAAPPVGTLHARANVLAALTMLFLLLTLPACHKHEEAPTAATAPTTQVALPALPKPTGVPKRLQTGVKIIQVKPPD